MGMRALASVLAALLVAGGSAGRPARADDPAAPEVAPALRPVAGWLADEDWTLRSLASWELRRSTDAGAVALIARLLEKEDDPFVLGCAVGSLKGRPRRDLVREGGGALAVSLVRLVAHRNGRVQALARGILADLASTPVEDRAGAWRAWLAESRSVLDQESLALRRAPRPHEPPKASVPLAPGETPSHAPTAEPYEWISEVRRSGLEVCVVLDDTGSMGPVIARAKAGAVALVRRLALVSPRLRVGLVTYKDAARVRLSLTPREEEFAAALAKVGASGGGDLEEGVDLGIRAALRQEAMGWSRSGWRVLVVIGDAPPHEGDVEPLDRFLRKAREDELFDHPVTVHTVSTDRAGVEHFARIAHVGGGKAVTLPDASHLVGEIVALALGGGYVERIRPWIEELERIRRESPD